MSRFFSDWLKSFGLRRTSEGVAHLQGCRDRGIGEVVSAGVGEATRRILKQTENGLGRHLGGLESRKGQREHVARQREMEKSEGMEGR